MKNHKPPWNRKHRWEHRPPWVHAHSRHPLPGESRKRRKLFWRFFGFLFFLAIPLLVVGLILGIYWRGFPELESPRSVMRVIFCSLPFLLPLMAFLLGARGFRNMVNPLANVMAAADAVAEGDFSVRVPERGNEEFRKLAHSFNNMAEELERSEHQRRNLTADVAHELRTPLHILQGNIEGVLDGVYTASPGQMEAMLDETRLLTRLVDDLRTLSLAEAGELFLEIGLVNVAELLEDVRTSFSGQAQSLGVGLHVEVPENAQAVTVEGDWDRLDQVLGNLVANALRYTPGGGSIILGAKSTPEGASVEGTSVEGASVEGVSIFVRDTGEGIPAADLPYVFDRFWKGDRARSRTGDAGSGLGLAIARQLARAHGGGISVESEVGRGTTFTVDLPSG